MDTTQKNRDTARVPETEATRRSQPAAQEQPRQLQPRRSAGDGQKRPAGAASEKRAAPKKTSAKKSPAKKQPSRLSLLTKKKAPAKKKPDTKGERPPKKPAEDEISAKKRSYGNSKPRKNAITTVSTMLKQSSRKKTDGKKPSRPKQPTPAVIYTQPQAFNRNRLIVQLATAVAVVAALVMGLAVFFKVEHITVSGAEVYDPYTVQKESGIEVGDNLLSFSRPRAGALIKANLPYVDTVRFGIKLPGTVNIIIEEDDVVYAIKDQNEAWWLINSDGRVVEQGTGSKAANHTQVLGVTLDNPMPDTPAVATEIIPTETIAGGEPAPVTVSNAQRLSAALDILQALEENDIVGSAASVDVSRLDDIILWYGTRYQVNLGDNSRLEYKIACMNDVILQMSDYQSGILDISFTIWPTQVGYTPFA